ncbi:DUF924 family protein [Sinorhizobium meliloti]|nr:DUF924 family protein [Sinorhizobium meliloti]
MTTGSRRIPDSMSSGARRFQASHLPCPETSTMSGARPRRTGWRAVILFDQMRRNMYRGSPLAFATDVWHWRRRSSPVGATPTWQCDGMARVFLYALRTLRNLTDQTIRSSCSRNSETPPTSTMRSAWDVIEPVRPLPASQCHFGRTSSPARKSTSRSPAPGSSMNHGENA